MIIPVRLGEASYDIEISRGAIDLAAEKIMKKDRKVCVVTDSGVPTEYAEKLLASLGDGAILHVFPQGEANKNFDTLRNIYKARIFNVMLEERMNELDIAYTDYHSSLTEQMIIDNKKEIK